MENDAIIGRLKALGLHGMAEAVNDLLRLPVQMRPNIETAVCKMIETETRYRDDKRTARLLKAAKLRIKAHVEDVKCGIDRNLTKDMLMTVADCGFVRRHQNLLITGLTGCGKTYLACVLGYQACTLGMKVLYLSMNHFVDMLRQARVDGSWNEFLAKLRKIELIILDDFGLQPMDSDARSGLLTLLDDRYEQNSIIITSQLPIEKWYDYISERTYADAIMDRIIGSSDHIELKGESMRRKNR